MSAVLSAEADSLDWVPVKSSNLEAAAYNPAFKRLFLRFKGGRRYSYDGIPAGVYEGLLSAPSKGQYVYYVIRAKGTDSVYAVRGPF